MGRRHREWRAGASLSTVSGENDAGGLPTAEQLNEQFRQFAGVAAEGVWRSPGRVNLIGEHTDYNDGLALPFAIDRATFVANRRRPESLDAVWSANLDKQVTADMDDVASGIRHISRAGLATRSG